MKKPRLTRRFWIISAGVVIILGILVFGLLPEAARLGLERWLDSHSRISAEVEDVDFNLFTGKMTVKTLLARRKGTGGLLEWERASFSIEWWPLTRKQIKLDDISLRDAEVTLRRKDGTWFIGGLKFRPAGKERKKAGWEFGAGSIDLENVRIVFRKGETSREVVLNGHLDPMQPWNPEKTSGFDLRVASDEWSIGFDGQAEPFAPSHQVRGKLTVRDLSLPWFAPLLPEGKALPEGTVSAETDLLLRLPPGGPREFGQSGVLSMSALSAKASGYRVSDSALRWDGEVHLLQAEGDAPPRLSVRGVLSSPKLNLEASGPAIALFASDLSVRQTLEMGTDKVPKGAAFLWAGDLSAGALRVVQGGRDTDLLSLAGAQIKGMRLEGSERMTADEIRIRGLSGRIVRDEQGILEIPTGTSGGGKGKTKRPIPLFRVGLLEIGEGSNLTYIDRSVKPTAELKVDPVQMHIEDVGNLTPEQSEKASRLVIRGGVNGKIVSFEGSGKPFARQRSIDGRLRLQALPLDWLKPLVGLKDLQDIKTFLSADTRMAFILPQGGGGFSMTQEGKISADGIGGAARGYRVADSALAWNGTMRLSYSAGKKPAVSMQGRLNAPNIDVQASAANLRARGKNFALDQKLEWGTDAVPANAAFLWEGGATIGSLRLTRGEGSPDLLSMDGLSLQGLRLSGTERVEAEAIRMRNPKFAEVPGEGGKSGEKSHVLAAKEFTLEKVLLRGRKWVQAGRVSLQGASGKFVRNAQGKMEFPELAPRKKGAPPKEKKKGNQEPTEFAIGKLEIGGGSRFLFLDRSVAPEVRLEMAPFEVKIENLDSTHSEMKSPVSIRARLGKYSEISVKGTVEAFTPKRTLHLDWKLNDFNLPRVTGYTERFIGYHIRSGDMNLAMDMAVERGELDSRVHLSLIKLKMEPVEQSEVKDKVVNELGFPLNTGLSLLRGKDNRIDLDFPVHGSLLKPEIGFASILRRPMLKAVRSAVLGYLSPVGAVAMLGKRLIFDRAVALRFDPAYFLPGQTDLIPDVKAYLKKVADKLKDRSESIVLCGAVTEGDIAALRSKNPSAQELLDLARRRSEQVKSFLISQGIKAERLILCAPEMDDDPQARPRVEIGV